MVVSVFAACVRWVGCFCLLISIWISAKSGHAHYRMFFFQQNPPLVFGQTMLWKWLKRSCLQLQCTLQAAHFSLAFSLLLLKFMPITWKTLRNTGADPGFLDQGFKLAEGG